MTYKLSHSIIKTKDHLKKIYPFIIEDIKDMQFNSRLSLINGYNYRNDKEALLVFRKLYKDCMNSPCEQHPTIRWIMASWLRRLYLCSGYSATDREYNNHILERFQLANYLEVNKDEIYKM